MNYVGRDPGAIPTAALAGRLLQSVAHVRGDYVVTAAAIPLDDTIPQIGEGVEWFTVNIAPKQIGSLLVLDYQAFICADAIGCSTIAALFRAGTPDALAVIELAIPGANHRTLTHINHEVVTASLAALTFSVRVGLTGGAQLRLNGNQAGRFFGGVMNSFLRVKEFSQ